MLVIIPILASILMIFIYLIICIVAEPWEKTAAYDANTLSAVFKFLFSMTKPVSIFAILIGIAAGIEKEIYEEDMHSGFGFKFWICAGSQISIILITMFVHGGGLVPIIMLFFALFRSLIGIISFFISKFIISYIPLYISDEELKNYERKNNYY